MKRTPSKKSISIDLDEKLFHQSFLTTDDTKWKMMSHNIAKAYAFAENAIAVVSDIKAGKSIIYYGGLGSLLGIADKGDVHEIDSIWEDEILSRVHPDDLVDKQLQELRFFGHIKEVAPNNCNDLYLESHLRMIDKDNEYRIVRHRILYFAQPGQDNVWLALCLYTISSSEDPVPHIVNTVTGEVLPLIPQEYTNPLSDRELEILRLIDNGMPSKEIAERLFISYNTVSRHRQNILLKLNVCNSVEACRLAKKLRII